MSVEKHEYRPETGSNLIDIIFVVGGEETIVKANLNNKLRKAIEEALKLSENSETRQFDEWKVRYNDVLITDLDKKIEEYNYVPGSFIYLSLDSGTGGN